MRLMHPCLLQPIQLTDDRIQVLVIENQNLFAKFVSDLLLQADGMGDSLVLSKNYKPIELSAAMEVILDFFRLSAEQKRIQAKLNAHLKRLAQQELQFETAEILSQIGGYYQKLSELSDFTLTYELSEDVAPLIKLGAIHIELDGTSPAERLLDYMDVCSDLCGISCFALVNLKSFLSNDQLELLYKTALYKKLRLLLLESTCRVGGLERYEHTLLIDSDMCELTLETKQ